MSTSKAKELKLKQPEKLKLKQSETVIIKRSQIKFAPYNPKRHGKEAISLQKKNFKDIGFLGGIVWNVTTGNLVAGHKRIMAIDLIYNYDGSPEKDYDVKVEKVELTEKQEKEQNIFMDARSTNTAQAYDLIAEILPDIDYKLAGLDQNELALITLDSPIIETGETGTIEQGFKDIGIDYEKQKAKIKKVKQELKKGLAQQQGASYITLSFDNYANKCEFMEAYGYNPDLILIKGEQFYDMLNGK